MKAACQQKLAAFVSHLGKVGLSVEEAINTQGENPSQRIDVEGRKSLGRIVLWNSGEWELEAISLETGDLVFWKSLNRPSDQELSEALAIWESHIKT